MRRYLILIAYGFLALLLQMTVFEKLRFIGIKPDIVLILIILFSLFNGPLDGVLAGTVLGILEALVLARFVGVSLIAKILVGALSGLLNKRFYKDNVLVSVSACFVGTLIFACFYYLLAPVFGVPLVLKEVLSVGLKLALYNAVFASIIYLPFKRTALEGLLSRTEYEFD